MTCHSGRECSFVKKRVCKMSESTTAAPRKGSRQRIAYLCCLIAIAVNTTLGGFKMFLGWISGSISVMGDGVNNLTDIITVVLLMMSFYLAGKPADNDHPFGHGRIEYLNSTLAAVVFLYVGVSLLVESVKKIIHPEPIIFSVSILAILITGMVAKLFLAWMYIKASKKIQSGAFAAYSLDSLSDIAATGGVLLSVLSEKYLGWPVDAWMGLIVSFLILWGGIGILKEALNAIIGAPPDKKRYEAIKEFILSRPGIYGVHDLIIHDYGPENQFITAHVEMDSRLSMMESHKIEEHLVNDLMERFGVQSVIHGDPKLLGNTHDPIYRKDLDEAIKRTGLPLAYHDFLITEEGRDGDIDLSFEITLTGKCKLSDEEIYKALDKEMRAIDHRYHIEISVDRNFMSGLKMGGDDYKI